MQPHSYLVPERRQPLTASCPSAQPDRQRHHIPELSCDHRLSCCLPLATSSTHPALYCPTPATYPEPAAEYWCTRHSTSPPQAPSLPRSSHTPRALHQGSPRSTPDRYPAGTCASTRCNAQSCHPHQSAAFCGEKHACACARHQLRHPLRCCLRLPRQQPAVLCCCQGLQQVSLELARLLLLPALGLAALACWSLPPALTALRCLLAASRWCGTSAAGAAATCSGRPLRCLQHSPGREQKP